MIKLKKGDIVTYRSGETNYVNRVEKYNKFYDKELNHIECRRLAIVKVQRYVKVLCFYKLKTIWERGYIK